MKTLCSACQLNGKEIPYQDPWDKQGVFTTLRWNAQWQCLHFKEAHLNRLITSARTFIQLKASPDFIESQWQKIRSKLELEQDYLVRWALYRPDILSIKATPFTETDAPLNGIPQRLSRPHPEIKNLHYGAIIKALERIDRQQEELILCDSKDFIAEGATSNLLFLEGQTIVIPSAAHLEGIVQKALLSGLPANYDLKARPISLQDLGHFDEIICCGSGKGVRSIRRIPEVQWERKSITHGILLKTIYQNQIKDQMEKDPL